MDEFDRWNELKKNTENKNISIKIKEGKIRWCRFGKNIGNEVLGKGALFLRPVLILKKYSGDIFLGIPVTTQVKTGNWYYRFTYNDLERCLILNQGKSFDKKRLEEKIVQITESELLKIKQAYCCLIMEKS